MTIGERIKRRREELGLSQDDLAKKMGYTSRSTVTKVEKGMHDITQSKVLEYAKALNVTPAYLMGWEEEEQERLFNESMAELLVTVRKDPNLQELVQRICRLSRYQQENLLLFVRSMQPYEHPER